MGVAPVEINILLIVGVGAWAIFMVAVLLFVIGVYFRAWPYAKNPQMQKAEYLSHCYDYGQVCIALKIGR